MARPSAVVVALAACLAAALGAAVAQSLLRRDPPPYSGANIVMVLADTLRADHVGAYGYPRDTTPFLDRMAASRGVLFERASAQAPCTFPSANSLLTSRYPQPFVARVERGGDPGIPPGIPSIAEVLQAADYATAAVSASPIVRATGSSANPSGGFGRGFDRFHEACEWRGAECVTPAATAALDRLAGEQPFFLYLHYMDPHDPYGAPPGFAPFSGAAGGADWAAAGDPNPLAEAIYQRQEEPEVEPEDLQHLVDRYDDGIAWFDRHLGDLVAELEARDLLARTVLVIVSDHGEEFLEHGHVKHCRTLHETELATPIVLLLPGQQGGRRVGRLVENLDVVPTLLDLVGVPVPEEMEGSSLRPLLSGAESGDDGLAFSWQAYQRSVRDRRFKLMAGVTGRWFRLYDLARDPGEQRDVLDERRREYFRLRQALRRWQGEHEGDPEEAVRQGDETMRQLRAVGYLQ